MCVKVKITNVSTIKDLKDLNIRLNLTVYNDKIQYQLMAKDHIEYNKEDHYITYEPGADDLTKFHSDIILSFINHIGYLYNNNTNNFPRVFTPKSLRDELLTTKYKPYIERKFQNTLIVGNLLKRISNTNPYIISEVGNKLYSYNAI